MKKLVAWVIVLILCFSISGCGNSSSEDVNSIMRTNDYKEDVIKFDDIEWLTELSKAEKKVKDDLLTTKNIYRSEFGGDVDGSTGSLLIGNNYSKDYKERDELKSQGKIAGWDIYGIEMIYVMNNNKKYVYRYNIAIKDFERGTNLELIEKDLMEKLDNKYGENNRNDNSEKNDYEWSDKNRNRVGIKLGGEYVSMMYECSNVYEGIEKIKKEESNKNKAEQEKKDKEVKENSKGL